ncbi:MAG: magnesium-dependent phosphatase-1 [Thermoprotei archaeon]|nr:MAG: magnesium-dependent phosphatase-1 [Thermoprotei archaeon]HDD33747.1 magnesium-dependent phosphatase-1 [Thermofilaceae archaeon]
MADVGLRNVKLIIFDLDGTLWDHPDVSSTSPPYQRIERDEIVDSRGERIRLRPCVRRLLEELRARGFRLAVASWNFPGPALRALEALGLLQLFDVVVVEPHPNKSSMLEKIFREVKVKEGEALFVDDNPAIIEGVRRRYPHLKIIRFREERPHLFCEMLDILQRMQ